jgi:hypothetical protein
MVSDIEKMGQLLILLMGLRSGGCMISDIEKMGQLLRVLLGISLGGSTVSFTPNPTTTQRWQRVIIFGNGKMVTIEGKQYELTEVTK